MRNIDWFEVFSTIAIAIMILVVVAVMVLMLIGMTQRFSDTVVILNKWSGTSTHYVKSGKVNVPITSTDFYFSTETAKFEYDPGASYVKYIEVGAKVCITYNGLNYIVDLKGCN